MREYIKKQLNKVVYADLSNYDESTNTYHIKKYSKPKFEVGGCYLVQIANEIYNQPNSVYAINWNEGRYPKSKYMKVYVNKMMGKMSYVTGRDYDYDNQLDLESMWSGWIPTDGMRQLEVLEER